MDLISASIIALIFGLTTALSFCAIHTLSTVAVFSIGSKKDLKFYPSLIALGHFSAITLIGVMVIFVASLVKEYLTYLQIPAILFILIIGIYLLIDRKSNVCHEGCSSCAKKNNLVNQNYFKAFIFGFSIGLLCVSAVFPLAGTVLLVHKLSELQMAILLVFYAIGHSLPILLVAHIPFLTQKFIKKEIPESKFLIMKKIAGLFLIAMSLFFFYDIIIKGDDHHHDHHHDYHYHCYDQKTAQAIAKQVGIKEVITEVLPNGKIELIKHLQKEGQMAAVGDGINDAPMLTQADAGIAAMVFSSL